MTAEPDGPKIIEFLTNSILPLAIISALIVYFGYLSTRKRFLDKEFFGENGRFNPTNILKMKDKV